MYFLKAVTVFLCLFVGYAFLDIVCENDDCCREIDNPNYESGEGFYQFNQECLDNQGGLNCVGATGCKLCKAPWSHANLEICNYFIFPVCDDEACCILWQRPNTETGQGYYEFDEDCLDGGEDCVDETGCRLCQAADADQNLRPVCQRFAGTGTPTQTPSSTCDDDECCIALQRPNTETGQGYFEFDEGCLDGGQDCIDEIGCRLCQAADADQNLRPVCQRFAGTGTPTPQVPCDDEECCIALQRPNPQTGQGYYEFDEDCLNGGEDCIDEIGCRLCQAADADQNLRPVCQRFIATGTPQAPCDDEACCIALQNPNNETGQGYYEFDESCLDGGQDCVDEIGCRLCREIGADDKSRPICDRFFP